MSAKRFVVWGMACADHPHCAVRGALTAVRNDLLRLREVDPAFSAMVVTKVHRANRPSSKHLFSVFLAAEGDTGAVLNRLRVLAFDFVNSYCTRPGYGVITLGGIRRARGGGMSTSHQVAVESV